MAWIIEENKLDAQQRDVLENLFYLHIQQKKSVQNRPLQAFY